MDGWSHAGAALEPAAEPVIPTWRQAGDVPGYRGWGEMGFAELAPARAPTDPLPARAPADQRPATPSHVDPSMSGQGVPGQGLGHGFSGPGQGGQRFSGQGLPGQGLPGQGFAGQTGQDEDSGQGDRGVVQARPGQDSAGQDSAGQDSAGQDSAGQDSAGQDSTGQDSTGRGITGQDGAGPDGTGRGYLGFPGPDRQPQPADPGPVNEPTDETFGARVPASAPPYPYEGDLEDAARHHPVAPRSGPPAGPASGPPAVIRQPMSPPVVPEVTHRQPPPRLPAAALGGYAPVQTGYRAAQSPYALPPSTTPTPAPAPPTPQPAPMNTLAQAPRQPTDQRAVQPPVAYERAPGQQPSPYEPYPGYGQRLGYEQRSPYAQPYAPQPGYDARAGYQPQPAHPEPDEPVAARPDEAESLPQRVPAAPDVPVVPSTPALDPPAETPALARIATHLRRDDVPAPPRDRPEGFDVNAVLAAVRGVAGVRDASLRTTPAGAHSLRLDLADGADAAIVSREVARLLQERLGLAAAPQQGAATPSAAPPATPAPPPGFVPATAGVADPPRVGRRRAGSAARGRENRAAEPGYTVRRDPYDAESAVQRQAPRPLVPNGVTGPRVVIDHVQVSTFGLDATVEVRLGAGAERAAGMASGPAVDGYVLRLCAVAAASAVDDLLASARLAEDRGRCFVEHAAVVPFGSCEVAVVVVLLVCGGWVEQLTGSALVAGDPRQAIVRATLAAVNRRLEALL
jgi:hypothetical protein